MQKKYPLDKFGILLDMIDASVFDYLIGNADRHQYETFEKDSDQGMLLHLDNAKRYDFRKGILRQMWIPASILYIKSNNS